MKEFPNFIIITTYFIFFKLISIETVKLEQRPIQSSPSKMCNGEMRLDVLPGKGWDNLRNKEMAQVIAVKYDQCKTTPDGKYLLPDNVFIAPLKQSDVQLFSQIIDKWTNYTSVTSQSFNLGMSYENSLVGISGSFSDDYQTTKMRQVNQKATTFRVEARYDVYAVQTVFSYELDPEFRARIENTIEPLIANDTNKLDYLLELIVRDYGTHFTTRMDAGAILVKEDFISRIFTESYSDNISKLKAAASASFFNTFKFSASYSTSTDTSLLEGYKESMTSSQVSTYGGSFFRPNSSVDQWIDTIADNLVAIDRMGDPIHFVITPRAFPNRSLEVLDRLRTELIQSISQYYSYNVHLGCLSMGSPNFDYSANVDNNQCKDPANNYTFGGVYQTCQGDQCGSANLSVKNPLTGDFSCPAIYTPFILKSGTLSKENCYEECHNYWIFWEKCHTKCYTSQTTYTAFWCAAMGSVPNNTGVMFGGVYTNKIENQLTDALSCPPTFADLTILQGLHVCIGNDYELGYKYSVGFGGFFSCQNGNPLYTRLKSMMKLFKQRTLSAGKEFVAQCPSGYTQHTAIIDQDCLVNYCVVANAFNGHGEIPVVLPPFKNFHSLFNNTTPKEKPNEPVSGMSTGTIVGIVFASIFAVLSVLLIISLIKIRRQHRLNTSPGYVDFSDEETPLAPSVSIVS